MRKLYVFFIKSKFLASINPLLKSVLPYDKKTAFHCFIGVIHRFYYSKYVNIYTFTTIESINTCINLLI